MIGLVGVFIPIIAIGGFFAWMLALSPVGRAYAEKLRGRGADGGAGDNAEVLQTVERLRREVAELAERVDFTERVLSQHKSGERIGPGGP